MFSPKTEGSRRRVSTGAFTLVELLVVIAVIAILCALLFPATNKAMSRAQSISCINNLNELEVCSHLYMNDYQDFLPLNQAGGFVTAPSSTNALIQADNTNSWCPGYAPYDLSPAVGVELGVLYPYNKSPTLYHCPADHSTVVGHPELLRTRSYCMSIGVNCPDVPNSFQKYTQMTAPPPSGVFVLIDDQEDDIYDATFGIFSSDSYWCDYWLDLPADRHNRGASVSFADGHAEHWKWQAAKIFVTTWQPTYDDNDLQDLQRLQACTKLGLD
jgi:prepilin-type processing-associated H-X9-DG protein/prepilin-type N-terminal cleavage/methylation domain-containing protein